MSAATLPRCPVPGPLVDWRAVRIFERAVAATICADTTGDPTTLGRAIHAITADVARATGHTPTTLSSHVRVAYRDDLRTLRNHKEITNG